MNQQKAHKQVCGWLNTRNEQGCLGRCVQDMQPCSFIVLSHPHTFLCAFCFISHSFNIVNVFVSC